MRLLIPLPQAAVQLRALVLALGEAVRPSWWKTEFLSETGLRFLERLYPRTFFQAAIHAAGRAACDVHDRAVGRVGAYHLFRLPEVLEAEIHQVPPDFDIEFVSRLRESLTRPDKLLELLATLYDVGAATDAAPGAKRIGTEKDLMIAVGLERTALAYYSALAQGKLSFPYFTTERSGRRERP